MRGVVLALSAVAVLCVRGQAYAQDPPPLPRVVVDVHGIVPVFPNDNAQLAASHDLSGVAELPGPGMGGRVGAHVYLFRIHGITVGVGGEVMLGRSSSAPSDTSSGLSEVDERLMSAATQLSFNFGTGHGWSYLSGGFGRAQWSLHALGQPETSADSESLTAANYGGGARWFVKTHLAFSLDVRIYEIQPGSAVDLRPGSPRTRLVVVGAGISLK